MAAGPSLDLTELFREAVLDRAPLYEPLPPFASSSPHLSTSYYKMLVSRSLGVLGFLLKETQGVFASPPHSLTLLLARQRGPNTVLAEGTVKIAKVQPLLEGFLLEK